MKTDPVLDETLPHQLGKEGVDGTLDVAGVELIHTAAIDDNLRQPGLGGGGGRDVP